MLTPRHRHRPLAALRVGLVAAGALAAGPAGAQDPVDVGYARAAPAEAVPPALALPDAPPVVQARRLAGEGRHAEAAEALEVGFRASNDVRYLVHAALERSAAGQHAPAIRHLEQTIPRIGAGDERRFVDDQLARARSRTTPVRLRLVDRRTGQPIPGPSLAEAQIVVRGLGPTDRPPELSLSSYGGEPLWLDPGAWSVKVRVPGFRPVELRRSPLWGAGEETWDVTLLAEQVAVTLNVTPGRALRNATLTLTPVRPPGSPLARPLERKDVTFVLHGGWWQAAVSTKRHEGSASFFVAENMKPVPLALRRRHDPSVRKFERNERYEIASGIMLIAHLVAGAGVTFAGAFKHQRADDRNARLLQRAIVDDATGDADGKPAIEQVEASYATPEFHADLGRAMNLEAGGMATLMSGVAILVPALTVSARARRRVAFIELGTGAALLAGGAAWLAVAVPARAARLAEDDPVDRVDRVALRPHTSANLGASMLTGFGAGLVVYTAVALIADARRKRRYGRLDPAPLAAPGLVGAGLAGRF